MAIIFLMIISAVFGAAFMELLIRYRCSNGGTWKNLAEYRDWDLRDGPPKNPVA